MKISVSVMCMDYKDMGRQFELLNDFTDAYHWDVMDGNYKAEPVSELGYAENAVSCHSQTYPCSSDGKHDRRIMLEHLIELGVSEISLHIDTVSRQMFRLMNLAEEAGAAVGAVLNPMETIDSLQYVLAAWHL